MSEFPVPLPAVIDESLAVFEFWRKLGYEAKDIYFQLSSRLKEPPEVAGLVQILMVLRNLGLEFTIITGFVAEGPEVVMQVRRDAGKRWNTILSEPERKEISEPERKEIFENSKVRGEAVPVLAMMVAKGLRPSKALN